MYTALVLRTVAPSFNFFPHFFLMVYGRILPAVTCRRPAGAGEPRPARDEHQHKHAGEGSNSTNLGFYGLSTVVLAS